MTAQGWSKPAAVPYAYGRLSMNVSATPAKDGGLWLAWPRDNWPTFATAITFPEETVDENVYAGRFEPDERVGDQDRAASAAALPGSRARPRRRAGRRRARARLAHARRRQGAPDPARRHPSPHRALARHPRHARRLDPRLLPLHARRGGDGLRAHQRPPVRRRARVLVVARGEARRHVPLARALRRDVRLRALDSISRTVTATSSAPSAAGRSSRSTARPATPDRSSPTSATTTGSGRCRKTTPRCSTRRCAGAAASPSRTPRPPPWAPTGATTIPRSRRWSRSSRATATATRSRERRSPTPRSSRSRRSPRRGPPATCRTRWPRATSSASSPAPTTSRPTSPTPWSGPRGARARRCSRR